MSKARIATEWLMVCSGCEISLLDIDEAIIDVLAKADIVRSPVLADIKEFVPADVGIVTGGIRNEHNIHVAKEMRDHCDVIVALGSCACFGGIPSLANMYTREEILEKVYIDTFGVDNPLGREPQDDVPKLTEKVSPLSSVIKVDVAIPGCPPVPELIGKAIFSLLDGIPLDSISQIRTTAMSTGPIMLAMFLAVAEKKSVSPQDFFIRLQNDVLKEHVARGTCIFPPDPSLKFATDVIEYCAKYL
ncbi:MAG: methylmalonyl-CoA mutase family protein, partial [Candidatus Hodarchaeota archaeon]